MCLASLWSAQIRLSHTLCVWPWFRTIVAHCAFVSCFAHFFFRPAKYTIKRRNLELSMRHSTVSSAHSLLVCVLSTIAYSPFEWNEESEIKYTQSNQRSRGYFNRSTTRFISKKIPFLNINYFQSTNKMSKQILNLLYYSIRSHFLCSTTTYSFLAISTLSFCIAKNIRWINLLSLPGIACKYVQ